MRLTKLVHSCLLVEAGQDRAIVDPGNYSWQSGVVKEEHLRNINFVVVTHAHPDHLNQEFAEALKKHSPNAKWYGPPQVVRQLSDWGINGRSDSDDPNIRFIESEHAGLSPWFSQQPDHTSFVVYNDLLVGGDCHTLTDGHGARIFGGAINGGPWGAAVGFTKMVESMKNRPQIVVPLHDWHWNDTAREAFYSQLPDVLQKFDVRFTALSNGTPKDV